MALARSPQLLVADEPTTALDETVQAQIIDLLRSLQSELSFSTLLITHNIALVREFSNRLLVMYAGQLVEQGPAEQLIRDPRHPYTYGLVQSIVSLEQGARPATSIEGVVPTPTKFGAGCRFVERCFRGEPGCGVAPPPLTQVAERRTLACYHPLEKARS
jgi:peptide/nickel transport system permease protein